MLSNAVSNPSGDNAKKLLRSITPLLRTVGRKIPWGPLQGASELPILYVILQRYGAHSDFITFSQSSATQPLVIRLGSRMFGRDNHPGLLKEGHIIWSSDRINRSKTARLSPASCATNFDLVAKGVLEALFGFAPLKGKCELVNTIPGIFGRYLKARACLGVTEAQARDGLHLHILLWLTFGPFWFARFVHDPDQREILANFIDSKVQASLTHELHLKRLIPQTYNYPTIKTNAEEVGAEGEVVATYVNFHQHRARCTKLPGGREHCDLAKKSKKL